MEVVSVKAPIFTFWRVRGAGTLTMNAARVRRIARRSAGGMPRAWFLASSERAAFYFFAVAVTSGSRATAARSVAPSICV